MYISYEDFVSYGGTVEATAFDRFAYRAGCEINNKTYNRVAQLDKVPECVKRCEFELIVYLSKKASDGNIANITSISNDGYSISYGEQKGSDAEIYDIIYTYLADTGLMYCGVE